MKENVLERKVWSRISSKWASFTGARLYTEFSNAILGKELVINGCTYVYNGNLY